MRTKVKKIENSRGGTFYAEVDYFIFNPLAFLAPDSICTYTHPCVHTSLYILSFPCPPSEPGA